MARVQLAALLLLALSCAGAVGSLLVSHSYRFEPLASQRLQVSSERQHMLTWWWCRGLRHQGLICASRERLLYPPCRVGFDTALLAVPGTAPCERVCHLSTQSDPGQLLS